MIEILEIKGHSSTQLTLRICHTPASTNTHTHSAQSQQGVSDTPLAFSLPPGPLLTLFALIHTESHTVPYKARHRGGQQLVC